MFRLIILVCLIHIAVGNTIRGRILLNGDANQVESIPIGSRLFIRLEQISDSYIIGLISQEIEITDLIAFPIDYQLEVPSDVPSTSSFRLSAQIKKRGRFLYVGGVTIPTTLGSDSPAIVNIPVRVIRGRRAVQSGLINIKRLSWPELVGHEGTYAVQYIKQRTGFTNVIIVPEGSMVTMDFRTDRVRVFINKDGIVTQTPRTG